MYVSFPSSTLRLSLAHLSLLTACAPELRELDVTGEEPVFLRQALLVPEALGAGGPSPGGRLLHREWTPGERVRLGDRQRLAPDRPECVPLFDVPLGDASKTVLQGGEAPDTVVAWSPDGHTLAIGSARGEILVVDARPGRILARRRLSEAMVKELAWAPDGGTLYAGEQSPDANLWALDPANLRTRWSYRLSDEVERSAPPPGDDLYGVYTLPAVYGLHVLSEGEILVAAVHAWNAPAADAPRGAPLERKNRSRLLLLDPEGGLLSAWPERGPADATLMHPRVHERAPATPEDRGLLVVPVGRSATGPPPLDLPVHGAVVLRLPDLTRVADFTPPPLLPHFPQPFVWDALDVDADAGRLLLGLGDGRVFLVPLPSPERSVEVHLGTPFEVGEVPLAASVGFGFLRDEQAVLLTARSNVPYGAASSATRPPGVHPGENTLFVLNPQGGTSWTWQGPPVLGGLTLAPDRRVFAVGAGPRAADDREDLFGALLFDLDAEGPGESHLLAWCPSESPAFFRMALSTDGFLALPVHPWLDASGALRGAYGVRVFR
jgi:hypothetical protein